MRDCVRFFLNGKSVEVAGDDAFLTVAEYLRRRCGLTGTKIVCAEGDCGSCAVLIGRLAATGPPHIHYSAVTSCIMMVFQLDAAHVVTVEGLRGGAELNPIQQSMVTCHGTQCGFCTPGFVVALHDLMDDGQPIDGEKVRRGLTGNLCRCTGYDSIIRAALAVDRSRLKSVDQLYPPSNFSNDLKRWADEEAAVKTPTRRFYKPITIEQAVRFRQDYPTCGVIAGGTDLGVVHNKRIAPITVALSIAGIPSQSAVHVGDKTMCLGAGATLATLASLAQEHIPELGRFMQWFGSPLIRNGGTIGGNLVTGSPIGDTIPALMVLGVEIEITGADGIRRVPISTFYTGYRKTVLAAGDLVSAVRIPLLRDAETLKLYKVSRRKDLDISTFGAAIWMKQADGVIADVRVALGGVGPMVMRLPRTETFLRGNSLTLQLFEQAGQIAREEVTPITDVRGTAEYRRMLAANILVKFWHESRGANSINE